MIMKIEDVHHNYKQQTMKTPLRIMVVRVNLDHLHPKIWRIYFIICHRLPKIIYGILLIQWPKYKRKIIIQVTYKIIFN